MAKKKARTITRANVKNKMVRVLKDSAADDPRRAMWQGPFLLEVFGRYSPRLSVAEEKAVSDFVTDLLYDDAEPFKLTTRKGKVYLDP